jgi:hypothetical protein
MFKKQGFSYFSPGPPLPPPRPVPAGKFPNYMYYVTMFDCNALDEID